MLQYTTVSDVTFRIPFSLYLNTASVTIARKNPPQPLAGDSGAQPARTSDAALSPTCPTLLTYVE